MNILPQKFTDVEVFMDTELIQCYLNYLHVRRYFVYSKFKNFQFPLLGSVFF